MPVLRTPSGEIDWAEVRRRLEAAGRGLDEALSPTGERARAILAERRRRLAEPAEAPGAGETIEILTFTLANERYAIETRCVREVARFVEFTAVPGAPAFVLGVTNLRGEIIPVADLGRIFGLDRRGLTDLSRNIVLGGERAEFGILADEAHEVSMLAADSLRAPPPSVSAGMRTYLKGVTDEALLVLDGSALLADRRMWSPDGR